MLFIKKLFALPSLLLGGLLSMFAVPVYAVVPAYVSTALTNAETVLTEYIEAAAPFLFAVTILVAAIFLIVRFIKRAAS
jgi:hypothetical protein